MKAPATLAERKRLPPTLLMGNALQHTSVHSLADHTPPASTRDGMQTPDLGHDFSQVPAQTESAACSVSPTRCPFGGACHACPLPVQAKLAVNRPGDKHEQEADRVAEDVTCMPECHHLQRKHVCGGIPDLTSEYTACHEKHQRLQWRAVNESGPTTAPSVVHEVLRSPGRPLDPTTRAFMEPRFGRELGHVRVFTDSNADRAACRVNALAFTIGNYIAFRQGHYAPQTQAGRRLLAHELAHVEQQNYESEPIVRRLAYGTGALPVWAGRTLTVVPPNERPKVDEAIAMVDAVVNNPADFAECHNHYAERCPGGNPGTLVTIWQRARLWRDTAGGKDALARGEENGSNMAYTQSGYDQNVHALARTLMHEAGHNCGIPGGDSHWRADQIAAYCIGTGRNVFAVSGGPYFGESGDVESGAAFLSYRRFLGDWASGHLDLTLGADLNFITTEAEIVEAAFDTPEEERLVGEFGSLMVGLRGRVSPWGGPRYGGLTGQIETGLGVGRFVLRPADPSERKRTSIEASWVLQIGAGAEFAVPNVFTEGRVMPVSIQAAYRLVQPLNSEAQRLHGIIGGVLESQF